MEKNNSYLGRRNFIKLGAAGLGSVPFMSFNLKSPLHSSFTNEMPPIHLFSKHIQFLNYKDMAEAASEMGFSGLDITVRPKGHVEPLEVSTQLPKVVEAMKVFNLSPQMLTTNVLNPSLKKDSDVLKVAGELGFSHYRMGWLKYPETRTIPESQKTFGNLFKELEAANKKYKLIGCYQNHAGKHVGAPIWDLPEMFEYTNNQHIGCQYDIRHAVVEGGKSWELGLRRIQPYIKSIVIKDFKWGFVNGAWKLINTPLGQGMVDFDLYFKLLKTYGINVPISLHLEYDLGGAEHGARKLTIPKNEVFSKMKKDLTFLKRTWQKANN